jgi:hypothetical protein
VDEPVGLPEVDVASHHQRRELDALGDRRLPALDEGGECARLDIVGGSAIMYEIRTYTLKPGSVAEVEKRFGEAYQYRKKYSPLAAFWHTEIGPLTRLLIPSAASGRARPAGNPRRG